LHGRQHQADKNGKDGDHPNNSISVKAFDEIEVQIFMAASGYLSEPEA
jgi:hypothetical protein